MRFLLDTHALLWWANNDSRLSRTARNNIQHSRNQILVSAASAWELAVKYNQGRLPSAQSLIADMPGYLREQNFEPLLITVEQAVTAGLLKGPHRDPFDRMLIAQALEEKIPIISNDEALDGYGAVRVW